MYKWHNCFSTSCFAITLGKSMGVFAQTHFGVVHDDSVASSDFIFEF